jgi:hypothetical protein
MLPTHGSDGQSMACSTRLLTLTVALLAAVTCCRRQDVTKRAFYFWRTVFALSPAEQAAMRQHRVDRLYLRLFDVVVERPSGRARPVAVCQLREAVPAGVEVVPVVYLENRLFAADPEPEQLAGKVWRLVHESAANAGFSFREMQVDCDWSDDTREAFFAFCRKLRAEASARSIRLSATIRLHQIKYATRTGIPPVDRGMLMFYNLGRLSAEPQMSSIFNREDAARYVQYVDRYPLPLDRALPIFSWAIHGRDGRIVELLDKVDRSALAALPALRETSPQRFSVTRSSLFRGSYLRQGDTLALENLPPVVARQAAETLAKHLTGRAQDTRDGRPAIALFDLDERNLKNYAPEDLESLFSVRH